MISEVDIRDWDRSIAAARDSLEILDDVGYPDTKKYLEEFIKKVEALVYVKQPQVAALFKEKK